MATHPCLPLWIDDWDAATAHLTPAEDGVYGRLIRLAWRTPGCSLPNDHAWIARKIRLTAGEFERIAKPVLTEFFTLQRGRLIQRRLKAEYENISRKKSGRVAAGKKGGLAKALKSHDNAASKATVLPADTRAFPEPYPDPEEKPPKPPEGAFDPIVGPEFEKAWGAYPDTTTSSRDQSQAAFLAELPRAGGAAPLARAVSAFAAHQADLGAKAKRAPAFHVWLTRRRYDTFLRPEPGADEPWPGPPALWAAVVASRGDAFAASWLGVSGWQDAPVKAVISPSTAFRRLRDEVGPVLDSMGIQLLERAA